MDYERIEKPQGGGGGLSPGKLRNMLLGVEKKRKQHQQEQQQEQEQEQEEQLESVYAFRSQLDHFDETGGSSSDNCKDVDVVSVLPECSTSTTTDSRAAQMVGDGSRLKDHSFVNSRIRSQEVPSLDYEMGHDNAIIPSSIFYFQKAERAPQRVPLAPFSKPAPSKWDDAQKWIASPTWNRPKTGQAQVQGGQGQRKMGNVLSRQPSTKVVVEVPEQKVVTFEEPDTKRVDTSQARKEAGVQKLKGWGADSYPIADSFGKPVLMIENSVGQSAISLSRHDSSLAIHSATTLIPPPSTARSVSMRDMGTEMTPIASQEPSRTGTPVRATTPIRSPTSSRPSTPGRAAPASSPTNPANDHLDANKELSEKELQMKTRREIMALGTQLGKMNIAAWASKEEEDNDASTSLKTIAANQHSKNVIETRAAAWEDAEKAKYVARFKREEMKIQAWENHQKAKTEAEMRKIEAKIKLQSCISDVVFSDQRCSKCVESRAMTLFIICMRVNKRKVIKHDELELELFLDVEKELLIQVQEIGLQPHKLGTEDLMLEISKEQVEVERIRGQSQDRLMNKLAAARHRAEEKRAAAEAKRNKRAAKTEEQAEYIRRTGRVPSSFTFCGWCS